MATTDDEWRIDDLAHKAGVTVDTIRYYQREGLLPAAAKSGRNKIYGPAHLVRIERIREFQDRRFSLAAIRALIESQPNGLADGVFGGSEQSYTFEQLVEKAGASPQVVQVALDSKLLRDPGDYGRQFYDSGDLELLRALIDLDGRGIPPAVVTELGRIYTEGVEQMQHRVVDLFGDSGRPEWTPEAFEAFRESSRSASPEMLPVVNRIVSYVHQRTLQRLTLEAISRRTGITPPTGAALPAPASKKKAREGFTTY